MNTPFNDKCSDNVTSAAPQPAATQLPATGATPETPLTDAQILKDGININGINRVLAGFARSLETRLHAAEAEVRRLKDYETSFEKAVEACSFMQDEQEELGLLLGQRTTVEGVGCLRKQRDQLRAELQTALAECADLRRTCDELTTDGNAVTLAQSLQRKCAELDAALTAWHAATREKGARQQGPTDGASDDYWRGYKARVDEALVVQPEPKHPTLWRYLDNARKAGVSHHTLVANVQPDGGFHFYIHPASVSGDTQDFLIWPDPFTHEDMLVNRLSIPAPDVEKFKASLTAYRAASVPPAATGTKGVAS